MVQTSYISYIINKSQGCIIYHKEYGQCTNFVWGRMVARLSVVIISCICNIKSLFSIPEINTILHINYISNINISVITLPPIRSHSETPEVRTSATFFWGGSNSIHFLKYRNRTSCCGAVD